jgi:hypothetical protein
MTITLSILGSRGVTVDVSPSALIEAADGIAITYGLYDGPLTFTISAEEDEQLAAATRDERAALTVDQVSGHCAPRGLPRPTRLALDLRTARGGTFDRFEGADGQVVFHVTGVSDLLGHVVLSDGQLPRHWRGSERARTLRRDA